MVAWNIFHKKPGTPQRVTSGRFEIERDGEVAYLEYSVSDGVLELIHTEVPEKLRGTGLAARLAETGLQYARDNKLKVDVICPLVLDYVSKHPEYSDLIMH
jgi:predicted GNAT family acetyltransferase